MIIFSTRSHLVLAMDTRYRATQPLVNVLQEKMQPVSMLLETSNTSERAYLLLTKPFKCICILKSYIWNSAENSTDYTRLTFGTYALIDSLLGASLTIQKA